MRAPEVTLTLLRHGRSRADDEQVHEGRYDSPLTEVGVEQARNLARYWAANPPGFDHVVSSPLVRAKETAQVVADELGLHVETSELWMEFDNGPFAGRPFAEIRDRYPTPQFRSRWDSLTSDGGESTAAFERRADAALEQTLESGRRTPLVVAHGGILNAALRRLLCATSAHFAFDDTTFAQVVLGPTSDVATLVSFGRPHTAEGR